MNKLFSVTFVLILFFQFTHAAIPLVQIGQNASPKIDGTLNDAGWQNCAQIFPFIENMGNGLAKVQTRVKLFYDDRALYVAFICNEPFVDKLVANHTQRDQDVWRDDGVEIHILSPNGKNSFHILFNSLGVTDDSKDGDYGWDPKLQIATFKQPEKQRWGVETAIPWSELGFAPQPGDSLAMNFTRMRQQEFERSAWNATYGTFRNPARYGQIIFAKNPVILKALKITDPVPGVNHARVQLQLPGNEPAQLFSDGVPPITISAAMKEPVDVRFLVGMNGREAVLTTKRNNRLLWRVVFPGDLGEEPFFSYLQRTIKSVKNMADFSTQQKDLIKSLLTDAEAAKNKMQQAMERSLETDVPLSAETFHTLNRAVRAAADAINQKTWIVWTKNNWDNVGRHEMPHSLDDVGKLKFDALMNEYQSGNIIISNLTNKPLRLRTSPTDFSWMRKNGEPLLFYGVTPTLFVADWQDTKTGLTVADPLIPLAPAGRLDIPAGESRQIWITIPPLDVPPGNYTCQLHIRTIGSYEAKAQAVAKTVDINLHVRQLRISTSPDFAVYNWDYADEESYVKDLFDHKVTYYLISTSIPMPEFDEQGNPLGPIDYSVYDRKLRIKHRYARKAGGKILFAYGLVESFNTAVKAKYGFAFRSAAWDRAFRYSYSHWLNHLKALGFTYDDFIVQVWDEALQEEIDKAIKGCRLMREIDPQVKLVMDGSQSMKDIERLDPYIDVWIPHMEVLEKRKDASELLHFYQTTKEPAYGYTCSINMKSLPVYDYYRLKPWYAAAFKLDGVFYWAYNSWRGDPWNDFDGPREASGVFYADCGAVYNGIHAPITSRRWEASREGIEDWQIIRRVQGLAKAAGKSGEIEAVLARDIQKVISHPDSLTFADGLREQFIKLALPLAEQDPLLILQPQGEEQAGKLTVTFRTNRKAAAKLLYRLVGTNEWIGKELPMSEKQQTTVVLPPAAHAEWMILAWDELGRVAFSTENQE